MKPMAVVILNWNGKRLLEQFLPSVVQYSPEASVYIADNDSSDDSVRFLTENFPDVKIIRNPENLGYAEGYNQALRFVEEEFYALVNSDVEVTEGWLQPVLQTFVDRPDVAVVQPKIRDFRRRDKFEYAGAAGGFIDAYGYPFCRGRIFDTVETDSGQYDDVAEIFWASGACLFIRKSVFRELGGFDGSFFAHQEEIDLCWRAANRNHKALYLSGSVVYHLGGATLDAANPQKTYLNFRNSLRMLVKNVPQHKLLGVLVARLVLDGAAAARMAAGGKWRHIGAILKAHFSFYMHFNRDYEKRGIFQTRRYYKVRSVVWKYYVAKRRVFTKLF